MKIQKLVLGFCVSGLVAGLAGFAQAQMCGLSIMDTAAPREQGSLEATPGVMIGQDMNFYGVRTTVSALDELRLFVDLGQVDVEEADGNFGVQGGGLYSLERNDFMDLGIRVAMYSANTDQLGLTGVNAMLVFSDELIKDNFYFYGGAGLDGVYKSINNEYTEDSDEVELNPSFSVGLSFMANAHISLFTEAAYVDGLYVGGGISIR